MKFKGSEQDRWFVDEVLPHESELLAWLKARYASVKDPEDVIQEAYARLLKSRKTGPVVNPRAFLFVTSRNLVLNRLRHLQYERPPGAKELDPLIIMDDGQSPVQSTILNEEVKTLIEAIQSLPKRCRQVLTLRKIYGYSQREVARQLGISENTVETQMGIGVKKCVQYFRAVGHLRSY